jgi:hypothetical protein
MTMNNHTAGRWEALGSYVRSVLPNGYSRPITRAYSVRHGSPGIEPDVSEEEAEANAKLIAAAPDLLTACRTALHEIDPKATEAIDLLHDAIAKATVRWHGLSIPLRSPGDD